MGQPGRVVYVHELINEPIRTSCESCNGLLAVVDFKMLSDGYVLLYICDDCGDVGLLGCGEESQSVRRRFWEAIQQQSEGTRVPRRIEFLPH